MSLIAKARELRTERARLVNESDKIFNKALTEKRSMTKEEEQSFDKMYNDSLALKIDIDRADKLIESQDEIGRVTDKRTAGREDIVAGSEAVVAPKDLDPEVHARYESLEFRHSMSNMSGAIASIYGDNVMPADLQSELNELRSKYGPLQRKMFDTSGMDETQKRALSATTSPSTAASGTTGSTTVPQGFVNKLEIALKYYGGILEAADYIDTDNGAPLPYPTINDTANSGELTAENNAVAGSDVNGVSSASAEVDPTYGVATFQAYMYDSGFVRVPVQLMQDSAFDVEGYLIDQLKNRIGRKLTTDFTTGNGSAKPQGVVVGATLGFTAAGGDTVTYSYSDIVSLIESLEPSYQNGPKVGFMGSQAARLAIRKMADTANRPLWITGGTAEGIVNRAPEKLLGYPYFLNQAVAVPAASAKSLLFGDFSKYKIRRVRQIGMAKVDQLFIANLQVGFLAYQRYDGKIVDAGTHPIVYLAHPAS